MTGTLTEKLQYIDEMISFILQRKSYLCSYEEGYLDALLELHPDYLSGNNIKFLERLYMRLDQIR